MDRPTMFGPRRLGASGLEVSPVGVGTIHWGDGKVPDSELSAVARASLDAGVSFFDTAELYTRGRSERQLGRCCAEDGRAVTVASKIAPYRFTRAQFGRALDATLHRLGRPSIDLYYLHFPYSVIPVGTWMDWMADAVEEGKIRAVGVSNCSVAQMRRAWNALARRGVPLAANQVCYSATHRKPETSGVLAACRELDVALVAYRPLLGKPRITATGAKEALGQTAVARIADDRGVTPSQVALNWLLCRDERIIVIPGSTKASHAIDNAAALRWRLDDEEMATLERLADSRWD